MNRALRKWNIDQLIESVKNSTCYTDVLRNLKLGIAGGNAYTIKKYIKDLNIDISHFDSKEAGTRKIRNIAKTKHLSPEQVFVVNSTCVPSTIRRFAKIHILYTCTLCELEQIWNGKKLVLQLDHINGIKTDNRKENLRWLCPNCHSQTDTYCGRNAFITGIIDTTNKCIDCLGKISKKAKRCRVCENRRKQIIPV